MIFKSSQPHYGEQVSLVDIFGTFFRIGLFTFGGGLAMSPVIRHELVIKRRWIQDHDFISVMSLATAVPGAIAVNISYLLGRSLRGVKGAFAAILGTILPSFFVILIIAGLLLQFFDYPKVIAFFRGCSIAIVGQLAFSGFIFGRKLLCNWPRLIVCIIGIAVIGILGMHPIVGLITASMLGYWLFPRSSKRGKTKC